ncbi:hypothetical protein B484DRAFT_191168 [Ochromonadaceae sp. CCMP2298]|nr:hypothetical protein B484DRAFT_191168 [Ochromonadaceae sp. CCMP2298]
MELPPLGHSARGTSSTQGTPETRHHEFIMGRDSKCSRLHDWAVANGKVVSDGSNQGMIFVDDTGVRRYVTNSERVFDIEEVHRSASAGADGCVSVFYSFDSGNVRASLGRTNTTLKNDYILDFRELWDAFEADPVDLVPTYLPLFCSYIEFFFHWRTTQAFVAVTLYGLFVDFTVSAVFPIAGEGIGLFLLIIYLLQILPLIIYLSILVLLKGRIYPTPITDQSTHKKTDTPILGGRMRPFNTHNWCAQAANLVRSTLADVSDLTQPELPEPKTLPFYHLMNNSLKFLSWHVKTEDIKGRLHTRLHKLKLAFILILYPICCILAVYVVPTSNYSSECSSCINVYKYKCI